MIGAGALHPLSSSCHWHLSVQVVQVWQPIQAQKELVPDPCESSHEKAASSHRSVALEPSVGIF